MVARTINAALKAKGVRCPAVVLGEDPSAWSSHVNGRRDPKWRTVEGWIASAWRKGWRIRLIVSHKGITATAAWTAPSA